MSSSLTRFPPALEVLSSPYLSSNIISAVGTILKKNSRNFFFFSFVAFTSPFLFADTVVEKNTLFSLLIMSKRYRSSSSTNKKAEAEEEEESKSTVHEKKGVTLVDRSKCIEEHVEPNLDSTLDYLRCTGNLAEMVRYYLIQRATVSTIQGILSLPRTQSITSSTSSSLSFSSSSSSSFYSPPPFHLVPFPQHRLSRTIHWTRLPTDAWKRVILPMLSYKDLLMNLQLVNRALFKWIQCTSWVIKLSLSLSLSHTHTHTHTQSLTHSLLFVCFFFTRLNK